MKTMLTMALLGVSLIPVVRAQNQGPVPISRVEPEYTDEARKAKWQGAALLRLTVDENGVPQNIAVVRSLGMGLDQKAIEAVQKWRFKPGLKDGKPVAAQATIEVNFRLADTAAVLAAADEIKANVLFNQQTFAFVSGQLISGPPVKGAPYSAEAVNETVQTLADGNRIVQRTSAMQYRDADGRERREETSAMGAIFISDPVAHFRYTLHPESQIAEKGPLVVNFGGSAPEAGVLVERTEAGLGRGVAIRLKTPGDALQEFTIATAGRLAVGVSNAKTEQLGNMFVEGVQAQGTRTTTTIPAGDIGNDRPISIVDERWYSPDLQMTVMTKHSDPRSGETNFALKNINRSSPPPNLFEVPSDYTVNAAGGVLGGRGVVIEHPIK
jgi:TonB family protein